MRISEIPKCAAFVLRQALMYYRMVMSSLWDHITLDLFSCPYLLMARIMGEYIQV